MERERALGDVPILCMQEEVELFVEMGQHALAEAHFANQLYTIFKCNLHNLLSNIRRCVARIHHG